MFSYYVTFILVSNMVERDHVLPPELATDILEMEEQYNVDILNCKTTLEPSIVEENIRETENSKLIEQYMYEALGVRLQGDNMPQEEDFVDLELCSRKKRLLSPNLITNVLQQENTKDELEFDSVRVSKLARSVFPQVPSTDTLSKPISRPREPAAVDISIQTTKTIPPAIAFVPHGLSLPLQPNHTLSEEIQLSCAVPRSVVPNIPITSSHALTPESVFPIVAPGIHQKIEDKYKASQATYATLTKLKSDGYHHPSCQKRHNAGCTTWDGPPVKKKVKDAILKKINHPLSRQVVQTSTVGSGSLEQSLPNFDKILEQD